MGFVQRLQTTTVTSAALTSTRVTFASANSTNDLLVAYVSWIGTATTVSVSDTANNTWTVLPVISNGIIQSQAVAYCASCNAFSGTNQVTFTLGSARTYL